MMLYFMGLFVIPCLSIFIATRSSLLYENFTYVGNQTRYRPIFIIWGLLLSLHMLVTFFTLLYITKNHKRMYWYLVSLLGLLHATSYVLPYDKSKSLLTSELHVYISISTFVAYIFLLLFYLYKLNHFYLFISSVKAMISLLVAMFFALLLTGDISSLVELINTNFMAIYMIILLKRTKPYF